MAKTPRQMPKVWDLSVEDAKSMLRMLGLPFDVHYAPNLVIPEGAFVAVSPPPGTDLSEETKIIVTLSSGPPLVPDKP